MKHINPSEYYDAFKEDNESFHWSLEELDLSKPEYIFREDCAIKLSTQGVEEILMEYVAQDLEAVEVM